MIVNLFNINFLLFLLQWHIQDSESETVSGCTINNNHQQRRTNQEKTSVTLSCPNNGFILVRNLTFGVHKTPLSSKSSTCSYQPGDCTTRTTFIGMECNGLTNCNLDLNPQYLHICTEYSDYMVLDYSCFQGPSLSVCDYQAESSSFIDDHREHRLFLRSPNYPNEYENSLNCSCRIESQQSKMKFLDFYLEERDETNHCSRDRLQVGNRSFCGSSLDDHKQTSSSISLESSTQLTFKSNDVITRKGFWLMIASEQAFQVSCSNLMDLPSTTFSSTIQTTTFETTKPMATLKPSINHSIISTVNLIESQHSDNTNHNNILNHNNNNTNNTNTNRRHTLSYVLLLTIVFVVILLVSNLILMILCWRQRRSREKMNSKIAGTSRPFFCSGRSASSTTSSMSYGETPVLTSLDSNKQTSLSSRYIFQNNSNRLDTTPSTSMTTTNTGPYEDLQDSFNNNNNNTNISNLSKTLQRSKPNEHSLYMQQRHGSTNCVISPNGGYNRMIHFPPAPIRCQFSTPVQTFYPPQPCFDPQHVYETIQDGLCPYQRLASTLRRPAQTSTSCMCYYEHAEQSYPSTLTQQQQNFILDVNPETLV